MSALKYVVFDTNIVLNRPQILLTMLDCFDKVFAPITVVQELDWQKDNGNTQQQQLASLCLGRFLELRGNARFVIDHGLTTYGRHDDQIFSVAVRLANENPGVLVYMLSNDKVFRLKNDGRQKNLMVITTDEMALMFRKATSYNMVASKVFFDSVSNRNIGTSKELSKKNIDVNYVDSATGFTPLIQAIRNKDYEMVNFLLTVPAVDINAVDQKRYNFPPISHAVQLRNLALVQILIKNGANVNEPSGNEKNAFNTPLMVASWGGDLAIVKLLVESGACINQQDRGNGFTPLIKATFRNHPNVVRYLLSVNADKSISSFERKTALDYAFEKDESGSHQAIISMLRGEHD